MIGDVLAFAVRLATGVRVREGDVRESGCVYFANHTSHLDALVIWSALPKQVRVVTSPVAARDYWDQTKLRRWVASRIFNAILLDRRGRRENGSHPLSAVSAALESGRSIIIFPEGTRSLDGEMGKFRAGLYHLWQRHPEVKLVPVSLENLNRILPKGQRLPVPLIGRIVVHQALEVFDGECREDFLTRAQELVASGLRKENHDE